MATKAEMEGRILTLTGEVASLKEQLAQGADNVASLGEQLEKAEATKLGLRATLRTVTGQAEASRLEAQAALTDMTAQTVQAKETKTQMESMIESLKGQGVTLKEKLLNAGAEIRRLRSPNPNEAKLPKTCINCGQAQAPIQLTETGYKCPACEHEWTNVEEAAPFRQTG